MPLVHWQACLSVFCRLGQRCASFRCTGVEARLCLRGLLTWSHELLSVPSSPQSRRQLAICWSHHDTIQPHQLPQSSSSPGGAHTSSVDRQRVWVYGDFRGRQCCWLKGTEENGKDKRRGSHGDYCLGAGGAHQSRHNWAMILRRGLRINKRGKSKQGQQTARSGTWGAESLTDHFACVSRPRDIPITEGQRHAQTPLQHREKRHGCSILAAGQMWKRDSQYRLLCCWYWPLVGRGQARRLAGRRCVGPGILLKRLPGDGAA